MTISSRLAQLEGNLGTDDMDRYVRSLSDEQLEAEISRLEQRARHCLTIRGVESEAMPIHDVLERLTEFEKLEAGHVDAA